jgi:DNA-binding MarR family transcriptional regulator
MNINKEIEKIMKDDDQPFIQVRKRYTDNSKNIGWIFDYKLSLQAYGLMAYLWYAVERTDDLELKYLALKFETTENHIKESIDELIEKGYLQISKVPKPKKVYRFDIFRNKYRTSSRYTSKDLL